MNGLDRTRRAARLVAPVLCAGLAMIAQAFGPEPPTFTDGEPRQRPEFEQVAAILQQRSAFFAQHRSAGVRAALRAGDLERGRRIALMDHLVMLLLQEGRVDEAVAASDELFDMLDGLPGVLDKNPMLWRRRGLTYLRKAEIDNCVRRHNAECCLYPLAGGGVHAIRGPAEEARRCYIAYLALRPDDLAVRWLLNVTAMALGDHPDGVPEELRISPVSKGGELARFPDVAGDLGVDAFDLCGGCVVDDLDGDGRLDIVTSTIDPGGPMRLFRNRGDGTFADVSTDARVDDQLGGLNIVGGDYDGDGDLDLLVLRGAWMFDDGRIRNSLLRNDGRGVFTDVTRRAGIDAPAAPTQAAAWGDYDGDGDLDLYIANESRADARLFPRDQAAGGDYPAQLFMNDGDGTFTDVARQAGVTNDRYAKGVAAGDFDNDGHLDLYVSNIGRNRLYRNEGDGTFVDVAEQLGVTEPAERSFATWFFDYDNDGWLDLFVTAYDAGLDDVAAHLVGLPFDATPPRLYRNRGDAGRPGFEDVTAEVGLDRPLLPMGASFGDLDNDGFLDIYLTTGGPSYEAIMPNVMLRNDGGTRFVDVTAAGGFGHLQKGHGVAFADIDDDGDQDVYHQLGGFFRGDAYRNALFLNPGHDNRFLTLRLHGIESGRSGHGARVRVDVATPAGPRSIHRAVGSVSSFGGSPRRQEIGLGAATEITTLRIEWPASGLVQRFGGVPLDAIVEAVEGRDTLTVVTPTPLRFSRGEGRTIRDADDDHDEPTSR